LIKDAIQHAICVSAGESTDKKDMANVLLLFGGDLDSHPVAHRCVFALP